MGRKVLAAKSGRVACPNAAAGGGIGAKNAKSFLTGLTGLREASVKPDKTKTSGVVWIGDIPEGWEVVPARHIFEEVTAKNKNGQYTRQLSFRYGEIVDKGPNQSHNASPEETILTYTIVEPDTIMINGLNLNYDILSLRVAIVKEIGIITSAYLAVVPQGSRIIPLYALYLLKAYDFKMVFHGQGSGIRMTLKFADFAALPIVLPPLIEQKAIAAYLDEKCGAIDEAIVEAKKGIEEYKAWKKSLIFEVVTGKRRVGFFNAESKCARDEVVGLPERSEPEGLQGAARRRVAEKMKSSGIPWIGDVPEGWKVMKLKYLIDVLPGYAFKSEGFDFSNGVRLLRGINVGVSSLKWDECVYWSSVINEELAAYQIQDGDLIIGLDRPWIADGTRVCFAKKEDLPCLLVQRVCRLRSLGGVILQIVNYWLSSEGFESALSCETTGVSVPHISPGQIMEFRIALPSLHEQRAIADCLDEKCAAIDAMIAEKEALIADLEAYKKSLIYETVTGKREVL